MNPKERESLREVKPQRGTLLYPLELYKNIIDIPEIGQEHLNRRHWHPEAEIILVDEGTLHMEVDEENISAPEGSVVFVNPTELHEFLSGSGKTVFFAFLFPVSYLESNEPDDAQIGVVDRLMTGEMSFPHLVFNDHPVYEELYGAMRELVNANIVRRKGFTLLTKSALFRILYLMFPYLLGSEEKNDLCRDMKNFIKANCTSQITLRTMAEQFHFSEKYLSEYFRSRAGCTFTDYLNSCRVKAACRTLAERDVSVSVTAESVGFSSVSHFIDVFRKHTGMTTLAYKKKAAKE